MLHRLRLPSVPQLATRLLPMAALLAGPLPLPAQQGIAGREAQRRVSLAQEADSLAAEGDAALNAGRTAEAVNRYNAALDRIAPGANALSASRQSIVEKFADASVSLAREQGEGGDLSRARLTLQAVLDDRAAPGYTPAQTLLKQLEDPDYFNPAQSPRHANDSKKVRDLFTLAEGMVQLADYKAAREAYNQILAVDEHNTAARRGIERVERLINDHLRSERDYTRAKMLNDVDSQWETTVPTAYRPTGVMKPGQMALPGEGVSSARLKMNTLVLDRVAMSDSPINEALAYLAKKSQDVDTAEPDPSLKGVNIVFNPAGRALSDFKTVTLDLRSPTLGEVLRNLADLTLTRLSFEGNTVTVSPLGAGSRLVTRSFRVPPGFLTRSGTATTDASTADPFASGGDQLDTGLKITRISAKDWLTQNGVPFPEGTSADYSAGSNTLIVRNTEENLDLVQTAVDSTTDKTQRQVMVKVVLLKAEQRHLQELGYDWLLNSASLLGQGVYAAGGTFGNAVTQGAGNGANYGLLQPNTGTTAVPVGNNPVTAGLRGAFELQTTATIDDLIQSGTAGSGLTANRSPGIVSVAGVFTSPQFQGILRGLNQKSGLDLSIGQTLILKAGQRASASSVRTIRYPTEFDPPQIPQTITGGPQFIDVDTGLIFELPTNDVPPVTPTTPQSFEDMDTGSTIEVEATIGDDGTTVDLNLAVLFKEFDGFINYGTPITASGQVLTDNKIFQPVFSTIKESAQVQVYDGATVTIGGLSDGKYETINDKVPLLGDLPFVGRFFRSDVTQVTRRAVIYFVSVKVIDPGGLGIQEAAAEAENAAVAAPDSEP